MIFCLYSCSNKYCLSGNKTFLLSSAPCVLYQLKKKKKKKTYIMPLVDGLASCFKFQFFIWALMSCVVLAQCVCLGLCFALIFSIHILI